MLSAENARTRQAALPADDLVLPFRTVNSDVIGRVVRLGSVVDAILSRHAYPGAREPCAGRGDRADRDARQRAQGQRQADPADQDRRCHSISWCRITRRREGARLRAASTRPTRAGAAEEAAGTRGALLGTGHLAMTIDPGSGRDSYQGIVALEQEPLLTAAHAYFRQSEQLPTFIRLAVARHFGSGGAGALALARRRPDDPAASARGRRRASCEGEAHDASLEGEDDENWNRARHLAATVEDHELIDPTLSPERLLFRLFHEEGVRVVPATELAESVPLLARATGNLSAALRRRGARRPARAGRRHHRRPASSARASIGSRRASLREVVPGLSRDPPSCPPDRLGESGSRDKSRDDTIS